MSGDETSKIIQKIDDSNYPEYVKEYLKTIFIFELKNSKKEKYNFSDFYDKFPKQNLKLLEDGM